MQKYPCGYLLRCVICVFPSSFVSVTWVCFRPRICFRFVVCFLSLFCFRFFFFLLLFSFLFFGSFFSFLFSSRLPFPVSISVLVSTSIFASASFFFRCYIHPRFCFFCGRVGDLPTLLVLLPRHLFPRC